MHAVVESAGGKITDLDGKVVTYNNKVTLKHGFIISNGLQHERIQELMRDADEH